jgi:hypothetical protein
MLIALWPASCPTPCHYGTEWGSYAADCEPLVENRRCVIHLSSRSR